MATLSEEDQRHITELDFEHCAVVLSPGCYLNHSCDPNAVRHGVDVYALRPIASGEEITIEYRINAYTDGKSWPCDCGATSCTGMVESSYFAMPARRQEEYLQWAPAFIRREYRRRKKAGPGDIPGRQ